MMTSLVFAGLCAAFVTLAVWHSFKSNGFSQTPNPSPMNANLDLTNHPGHADHDPTKDRNWIPLTSEAQAQAASRRALALIEEAQTLLYLAAQECCELQGWRIQWERIGKKADETKALWHKIHDGPRPTGHACFPKTLTGKVEA